MDAKSALKVVTDTDETNDQYQREPGGKFAPGNKGGPGGSRPSSGRKPQPADETLLKRLYDLLDGNADKALQVLVDQLKDEDPKIAQKAAAIVLSKVLPEDRFLKSWREKGEEAVEELAVFKDFLAFKRDRDVAKSEKKETDEPDHPPEPGQELDEKGKTGK